MINYEQDFVCNAMKAVESLYFYGPHVKSKFYNPVVYGSQTCFYKTRLVLVRNAELISAKDFFLMLTHLLQLIYAKDFFKYFFFASVFFLLFEFLALIAS